jgi:hypothetical protein
VTATHADSNATRAKLFIRIDLGPSLPTGLRGIYFGGHRFRQVRREREPPFGQLGERRRRIEVALDGNHRVHNAFDAYRRAASNPADAPATTLPAHDAAKSGMNSAPVARVSTASRIATATPMSVPLSSGRSSVRTARNPKTNVKMAPAIGPSHLCYGHRADPVSN